MLTPAINHPPSALVRYRPLPTVGVAAGRQATGIAVGPCPKPELPSRIWPPPLLGKPPAVLSVIAHQAGIAPAAADLG